MLFRQLLDPETSTYTYLLADRETRVAVLIDPVLEQHERDLRLLRELSLELLWCLETHIHADHVTGGGSLREVLGCGLAVSETASTTAFDRRLHDGDTVEFGRHVLEVRATPGHTDTCLTYIDHENHRAFTGDALLIRGCGRTDFQSGDAHQLYRSVHRRILSLPEETLLYPGHDYDGHTVTTVGEERLHNPRLGGGRDEQAFVEIMAKLELSPPKRIQVAVPANLRAGRMVD